MQTLNKFVLDAIADLNEYKGRGYKWPAKIDGSIGDVVYNGKVILKGNPDNYTYCCGITLQTYLMAVNKAKIKIDADLWEIRKKWFIMNPKMPIDINGGAVDALQPLGLGVRVAIDMAEPGDFIQLWRKSGSGHSAIFIKAFTDNGIRGIKYWSTQAMTNGIGYRSEYFEGVKNPIAKVHICRTTIPGK